VPRQLWIAGPAALLLAALAALFAALAYGGGADAGVFADAGAVVRYGLPVAKLLVDLSAAVTIGALVLTAFAFDPGRDDTGRVLDIAAAAAAVWAIASASSGLFTYVLNFTTGFSLDETFGANLGVFLTETELGQSWLATTLIAAAVTVLCFAVRNTSLLAAVAVLAAVGLYPMASQGHAGGTENHDAAVTALYLHILFAAAWLGGLIVLALQRRALGDRLVPVLTRYSTVALVSFIVVAVSGFVSAQLRIADFDNLLTPYGILVLVKVAALLALGLFGAAYRRVVIGRMQRPGARETSLFWALATAELAFMGVAAGVAAALGRTATPVPQTPASELTDPTPAELLTGAPLPPEPTPLLLATSVQIDLLWLLVAGFGIAFYLLGVLRLRRRGDAWPVHRTVLWIAGMLLLVYVTNGGVAVYERYLFSAHMVAHMVLGMMVPLLLVPGAPITLALRAIEKRIDGSRGGREWLLLVVHSRVFAFLANPLVAAGLFVGSLWAFYYTPLFSWATSDHLGHVWMVVHFLATGYLFTSVMIGIDPSPQRPGYPVRLLILLGAMAFHAFFGLALIMGEGMLLADWYGAMGWGGDAMADQRVAGGIAWSIGELPTLVLAVSVAVLWYRSDRRESVRYDRRAERDGDAELEAYNAMLTDRARRG
jgi:cytochrome c oxidase assembly factor CtaG